MVNVEEDIT